MKFKLNGKGKGKKKSKKSKEEPKQPEAKAEKERRKPLYGTAQGPLSDRASRVDEAIDAAINLLTSVATELDTWTAADGNAIREIANSPDASVFWDHTMRVLGRDIPGRALLKDASEQAMKLTNQLNWFQWAFKAVAVYDAAKRTSRDNLRRGQEKKPEPAKKRGGKKKTGKKKTGKRTRLNL